MDSASKEKFKIQYNINFNDDLKCLHVTAEGVASGEDFINIAKDLMSHPEFKPGSSVLHDYSLVNMEDLSSREVREISDFIAIYKYKFDNGKWALVFYDDLGFGLARMWQAFTEYNVKLIITIFKDKKEALEWLEH